VRFLSPHPGYSIQVIEGKESREVDQVTGQAYTRTDKVPYIANFEAGHGLFPHEVELGLETFERAGAFGGLPENTNPKTRLAVWDSEAHKIFNGWSDEYHDAIVKRMVHLASQAPTRLIAVPESWRPKPWPKYDEQDADEILAYVETLGIDPETVRLYEAENQKRKELIDALRALRDKDGPQVEDSVIVGVVSA
jgi:hypothetical protein